MNWNIFNLFRYKPSPIAQPHMIEVTGMRNIIEAIAEKHKSVGFKMNAPATLSQITQFERQSGFPLPIDFKEFYSICNGFECTEDIFNMTPLEDVEYSPKAEETKWFYFAEYMIFSDSWGLRLTVDEKYEIFNGSYPRIAMTSSLEEFLNRFLWGNVFEEGGLYHLQEELGIGK